MESQVSLVSRFVPDSRPHEADEIVIAMLLIVRSEEEGVGENGSDLDKVGLGWLAVFDLGLFSSCFKDSGELFGRHGVRYCLSAWSWSPSMVVSGLLAFVDGLSSEVNN